MTPAFIMAVPWQQTRARRAIHLARTIDAEIVWDQRHDAPGRTFMMNQCHYLPEGMAW